MKPELLAPAGNLEKLMFAAEYGADAVYFGAEFGSLRSFAGNFTVEQAERGLKYLHERGRKGYLTLNIYPFTEEYDRIIETARQMDAVGADAIIVSDLGVISELRKNNIKAPIHISTQANTTSAQTCLAYADMGAKRVNLARELSLERIRRIRTELGGRIETEVFAHGAVCFSYSGRCAISDYMTGYAANRGQCKHPCRWNYHLVEEKRPGEYYPVFEDERGLYLFNCKDLALFEYVGALAEAGVNSLKIEGRMKSVHYIASTVSLYRRILDGQSITSERAFELLCRVPNRGYTAGFIRGTFEPEDYSVGKSLSQAGALFVGNVLKDTHAGKTVVEVRNKITAGDELEVLTPAGGIKTIKLSDPLITTDGKKEREVNNSKFIVLDESLPAFSIIRKILKTDNSGRQ